MNQQYSKGTNQIIWESKYKENKPHPKEKELRGVQATSVGKKRPQDPRAGNLRESTSHKKWRQK